MECGVDGISIIVGSPKKEIKKAKHIDNTLKLTSIFILTLHLRDVPIEHSNTY